MQTAMDSKYLFDLDESHVNLLDSLEIGKFAFDKRQYKYAEKWLNSSLKKIEKLNPEQRNLFNILGVLNESQVQQLRDETILKTKIIK